MRARTTLAKTTAVISVGLLAVACGNSTPSHEAFTKKVKGICAASTARHQKVAPDFDFSSFDPDTSDLATMVPVIEGHVAISKETVAQLDKVRGPKTDTAKLDKHIAVAKQLHELADDEIAAAKAGDRSEFKRLTTREEELQSQLSDDTFAEC